MEAAWTLVLPIRLAGTKQRLSGLTGPARQALAVAMARDVIDMASQASGIDRICLLTDDMGAAAFADTTQIPSPTAIGIILDGGRGLNDEITRAAPHEGPVVVLLPDVPAARSDDLEWALAQARDHDRAFVADADGVGTTMITARDGSTLAAHFGPRSCARHAASGAVSIRDDRPGRLARLRRDVDDEIALQDAAALGVGRHTRAVVESL